ncbi:MAG: hypothetical protein IJS60_04745 [Abditibacteriota bacterium]|nr:hypothetical protein [Abditibacteriota bacterium]
MKKLLQSTIVRVVCKVLVIAMLATLVPNGLTTKAYAQSGSALGSEPAKRVGVLEFINDSDRFGQIVTKNATSAFIMECNKTEKTFVIEASPEEVNAKMEELGIRYPATQQDCVTLATELELDGMIQGFIKSITVRGSGSNKVASATVVIQYVDRATGEILMGTQAKGESSARIGFTADEDTLVIEAVKKAIGVAHYNLSNYSIPKAYIHANEGNDKVILNAGVRNNLYPGLRMVVMRGAYPMPDENLEDSTIITEMRVVGYIEVVTVGSIDAIGKIIKQNVGVKPEDVCYGLYDNVYVSKYSPMEDSASSVNTKAAQANAKRKQTATNLGYTVLAIAALVGLASLFSSKGGDESGPSVESATTPGYFKIKANSNGYITGKILGIRIFKDDGIEYVDLKNGDDGETSGTYDGRNDVVVNVFKLFPASEVNKQSKYYAKWIYTDTSYNDDGDAVVSTQYSSASGSVKWTLFEKPYNLEPSSYIDANSFEEGTAFVWDCSAYSTENVNVQYKVEIWDTTNASNKKVFTTNKKYLDTSALDELYSFFSKTGIDKHTFMWRVGVINTQDSNSNGYLWSSNVSFSVDSLPPAPPTKGVRRH